MFLNLNETQQHALDAAKQAFMPMLEGLIKYSIPITLVTFVLGLIIALATALMRVSDHAAARGIARFYVSIIRGTPMIVQLFIIFYGIPEIGRLMTMRRIILPQALRVSVPALGNTFLSLIKDTSLLGFILVAEMFRKAQEVAATSYEFLSIYLLVAVMYWVVCFIISLVQGMYERRLERKYTI